MEYAGISDIGLKRSMNQDAIYMAAEGDCGIFCVADGMGGHSRGELASQEIAGAVAGWWNSFQEQAFDFDFLRMIQSLHQMMELANQTIHNMSKGEEICGSTVVLLFVCHDKYGILSAGDSRIYLYDRMRLKSLTVDDVWENQPDLQLDKKAIRRHPSAGRLVNAIGAFDQIKLKSSTACARRGMVFLLCSDGLYKLCTRRDIRRSLRKSRTMPLKEAVDGLLQMAYEKGAGDNVSIVLVRI